MDVLSYSIHIQFFSQNHSLQSSIWNQIIIKKSDTRIRKRKTKSMTMMMMVTTMKQQQQQQRRQQVCIRFDGYPAVFNMYTILLTTQQYTHTSWFGLVWFDLIHLIRIVATYSNSPTTTYKSIHQVMQSIHVLLLFYLDGLYYTDSFQRTNTKYIHEITKE